MSLFCVGIPSRILHYIQLSCLPKLLETVTVSQIFLVFGELKSLRSPSQIFCRLSFSLGLSDVSLVVRLRCDGVVVRKTRVKCCVSLHHISYISTYSIHTYQQKTADGNLDCVDELTFVTFFPWGCSFPPFRPVLLGRKPTLKVGELASTSWAGGWGISIYVHYLMFCSRGSPTHTPFTYLFNTSFRTVWNCGYLFRTSAGSNSENCFPPSAIHLYTCVVASEGFTGSTPRPPLSFSSQSSVLA